MTDWTITDVHRGAYASLFGGESRPYVAATLTHISGAVMGVSRYDDDGRDDWGVDSAIGANGMPQWVHGEADRTCRVQTIGDRATLDALDAATVGIRPAWLLWNGGASYSAPYVDDDTEAFPTVDDALAACQDRYANRDGSTPCVTDDATPWVYLSDPRGTVDPYPDYLATLTDGGDYTLTPA